MPAPLRILLLGPPAVFYQDHPIDIPRREVRSLLYYLACQRAPLSRDHVVDLFWPKRSEEDGRKRLREILARLKKALPDSDLLNASTEHIGLAHGWFTTDVLEFQAIIDEVGRPLAQIPDTTPLPQPIYQKIVAGVQLWRSPTFLAGARLPEAVGLEEWQMRMHQNLETSYLHLLQRLADHDLATGNLEQAAAWLRNASEIDPFNENLHERMILLYERRGWFAEALAYLKRTRALYAREHLPHFPAVLEQIEKRLRKSLTVPRDDQPALWPSQRASQVPLFGREGELAHLRAAYQRGGVVLLRGEAGSGKTRLVEELYRSLQPPPRMLAAFCRQMEENLPFQPIIDMLRSQVSADEWRKLSKSWLSAINLMLPELSTIFPDLPKLPAPSAVTQSLLYESLHQAFLVISANQRVLLFIENAHWCDESSLGALAYLYEHQVFGRSATLVLATRIEDQSPALTRFLNHLGSQNALVEIPTSPLSAEAVAHLAEYVLGQGTSPEAAARLRRDTGGNPLFLLENLRALLEEPIDLKDSTALARLPLSSSFHALVQERFRLLSSDAQQVLTTAAVIGGEFELPVLESCANLDPETIIAALEELERRHLILPSPGELSIRYRFAHDQVREIVHQQLSPARRRLYHLRVVEVLVNRLTPGDTSQAATIAHHYELAGEALAAFNHWLEAAQYARKLHSLPEAFTAFQRAEHLLAQLNLQVPDASVFTLYAAWIDLAFNSAYPDELFHAAQALLRNGFIRQSNFLVEKGYLGQAAAANLREDPNEGLEMLDLALPYLQMHDDATDWAQYHYERGGFMLLSSRIQESIHEHEEALRRVESSHDPTHIQGRAYIRYRLALAYLLNGWPARARRQAELVVEESRRAINHATGARGMSMLAQSEFALGRFTSALEHGMFALRMALPMKNPRLIVSMHNILAESLLALGRLDEAYEQTCHALELCSPSEYPHIFTYTMRIRGDIHAALWDFEAAEACYRKSMADQPLSHATSDARRALGWLLTQTGRPEEGLQVLNEASRFAEAGGLHQYRLAAQQERGWALMKLGDYEQAARLADQVALEATERDLPLLRVLSYWLLSELALCQGRADEALQKLHAVIRLAQELSAVMLEMHAIHQAGRRFDVDNAVLRDRLRTLYSTLGENTRRPELQPAFEKLSTSLQFRN